MTRTLLTPTSAQLNEWAKSQHEEDRLILSLLDGSSEPFFVDVGANDGFSWSNSYLFGKLGYDLLLIEPMPKYAQLCRDLYASASNVQVEELAICAHRGEAEFYVNLDVAADLLAMRSSLDRGTVPGGDVEKITVRTAPLDDVLERSGCPNDYAVLSIDAEGKDPEVLDTTDLERFRPQIICVEEQIFGDLIPRRLAGRGYAFVTRLGPNGIYRRAV